MLYIFKICEYVFASPEFTREVTDTQMPLVAPVILPEMYKIFTMAEVTTLIAFPTPANATGSVYVWIVFAFLLWQVYSIRTRSRAVEIFTTCANLICAIEELEKVRAHSEFVIIHTIRSKIF